MPSGDALAGAAGAVVGGVLGVVVHAALHSSGLIFPVAYAIGLGAAVGVLAVLLVQVIRAVDLPLPRRAVAVHEPVADDPVLAPWERRLSAAVRDRRSFVATIQPALRDVARDRVRMHRALDLDRLLLDPGAARLILGDDLCQWLTTTDRDGTPPTRRQLELLVAAVEAL